MPDSPKAGAAAPDLGGYAAAFRELLAEQGPDCIVIDEGHKLSNPASCITRALKRVRTRERVICTGTPIQNNVSEYFAMVDYVRPGYWDRDEFRSLYTTTIRHGQRSASTPQQVRRMEVCPAPATDVLRQRAHQPALLDRQSSMQRVCAAGPGGGGGGAAGPSPCVRHPPSPPPPPPEF